MTDAEKVTIVQGILNDAQATDALVAVYLSSASDEIMHLLYRAYPEIPEGATLPRRYEDLQCRLAVRKFVRRAGEGEIAHNENGVNRSYGSVDDADLLCQVMPYARVL